MGCLVHLGRGLFLGFVNLVLGHRSGFAALRGQAAFDGDVAHLVGHEDGARLHLALFGFGIAGDRGVAHAQLEAADIDGRDFKLTEQGLVEGALVGDDRRDLAALLEEFDAAHAAEGFAVLGEDGHGLPHGAAVPLDAQLLADGRTVVAFQVHVGKAHAPVFPFEAVDGDEQVLAAKHPQQIGAFHEEAQAALLGGVEDKVTHLADALGPLLAAHHARSVEVFGRVGLRNFHPAPF